MKKIMKLYETNYAQKFIKILLIKFMKPHFQMTFPALFCTMYIMLHLFFYLILIIKLSHNFTVVFTPNAKKEKLFIFQHSVL